MGWKNNFYREVEPADPKDLETEIRDLDAQLRSITEARDRANLLLRRAVVLGLLHKFEQARADLRRAVEADGTSGDTNFAAEFINSTLYDEERKTEEAVQHINRLLGTHERILRTPEYRYFYEDLQQRRAFDLVALEQFEEAIPALNECLSFALSGDKRAIALCKLGYSQIKLQLYEAAARNLSEACNLRPPKIWEGEAHFHLGATYFKLGRLIEAREELLLCERNALEYDLPMKNVYQGLAGISRALGDLSASENYARLARGWKS